MSGIYVEKAASDQLIKLMTSGVCAKHYHCQLFHSLMTNTDQFRKY